MKYEETKYGFTYGPATVERMISDEKKGWAMLQVLTGRDRLQVYVTKTGKVRVWNKAGEELRPSKGSE